MKNKGFTLIELLAVIVILAIIALITVPVVINIINNTKKGAAEDSTYGVIESLKLYWMVQQNDFHENEKIVLTCTDEVCMMNDQMVPIETFYSLISGTKPTGGKYTLENGDVSVENVKFGDFYCSTEQNGKVSCSKTKKESTVLK